MNAWSFRWLYCFCVEKNKVELPTLGLELLEAGKFGCQACLGSVARIVL